MSSTAAPKLGRLRAHLIKGAAGSFARRVGFSRFPFSNTIILARVSSVGGYGTFANAVAWVCLLTIMSAFLMDGTID